MVDHSAMWLEFYIDSGALLLFSLGACVAAAATFALMEFRSGQLQANFTLEKARKSQWLHLWSGIAFSLAAIGYWLAGNPNILLLPLVSFQLVMICVLAARMNASKADKGS
jgi:hypothetical protein